MKVGIHQLNYFPWIGYFDKIAQCDIFIVLDEVQLTDSSYMQRNRLLNKNGVPSWLTVAFIKKNYLEKKFNELLINKSVNWQQKQRNFIMDTYKKSPYFEEVWEKIKSVFEDDFETLFQVNKKAFEIIIKILDIKTKIIYQSSIDYNFNAKKNDLVLELCKSVNADSYISGVGAMKYMDEAPFKQAGISVTYQDYTPPKYTQTYSSEFVPGLSILDMLLNCGIEKTKELFWAGQGRAICSSEI